MVFHFLLQGFQPLPFSRPLCLSLTRLKRRVLAIFLSGDHSLFLFYFFTPGLRALNLALAETCPSTKTLHLSLYLFSQP